MDTASNMSETSISCLLTNLLHHGKHASYYKQWTLSVINLRPN